MKRPVLRLMFLVVMIAGVACIRFHLDWDPDPPLYRFPVTGQMTVTELSVGDSSLLPPFRDVVFDFGDLEWSDLNTPHPFTWSGVHEQKGPFSITGQQSQQGQYITDHFVITQIILTFDPQASHLFCPPRTQYVFTMRSYTRRLDSYQEITMEEGAPTGSQPVRFVAVRTL